MHLPKDAQLLRIFIGDGDTRDGLPLYEAIVRLAREKGLAGATALRGVMGFGANSRVHTDKILRLSEGMPMVVEIVDSAERIGEFLPLVDAMMDEGLVTLEKIQVMVYRHGDAAGE